MLKRSSCSSGQVQPVIIVYYGIGAIQDQRARGIKGCIINRVGIIGKPLLENSSVQFISFIGWNFTIDFFERPPKARQRK